MCTLVAIFCAFLITKNCAVVTSIYMLAGLVLLEEKIDSEQEFPLMSMRDARILMVFHLFGTIEQYNKRLDQMKKRHVNRKKDIDKYYRYDKLRL